MLTADLVEHLRLAEPTADHERLHLLAYQCQAWHMAITGQPLIVDGTFVAHDDGPRLRQANGTDPFAPEPGAPQAPSAAADTTERE